MIGLIRFFVGRHLLVNVIVIGLVIMGLFTMTQSQREGFPAVTINLLVVRAMLPGASAEQVEDEVVSVMEEAVETVDGVDTYHTVITDNLAVMRVELLESLTADEILERRSDLQQALDAVRFPEEMDNDPVVKAISPGLLPILEIALSGPTEQLAEAAELLEDRIGRLDTISKVTRVGLPPPEVRVLVDPLRADAHGIAITDVMSAIERRNITGTGGTLHTASDRKQVVLHGRWTDPSEVGETPIIGMGGQIVRVRDVARIEHTRKDLGLRVHTNAEPGVALVVSKREGADIISAADAVRAILAETPLPADVNAVVVNDVSFFTSNRLALMQSNGLMGLVLVVGTLLLFLTPRTAVWVTVGVPVVMLGVLVLMPSLGMTVNLISLAGFVVVLGMLVDDAVVVAERIVFYKNGGMEGHEAAVKGTSEVMQPVFASAITTMLAFTPLLFLGGLPGKIAWYIPAVVTLSLLLSLVESYFILPAHMSGGGTKTQPKRAFVVRLERWYAALLHRLLPFRVVVLGGFVALFVFTMGVVVPFMGFQLFPQDDSDSLFLKIDTPLGTPIEKTEAAVTAIEAQLPILCGSDLLAVTSRIGHQEPEQNSQTVGSAENEAVISVIFKPLGRERTSAAWAAILAESLVIPEGTEVLYEPKILGPPIGRPITVHISSHDDGMRRRTGQILTDYLSSVPGVVDISMDERPGIRQIDLDVDWDALAQLQLDAELVSLTLKAAFYGLEVTELRQGNETTTFRVLFDPNARQSLDALLDMPIRNRTGQLVRLRQVVYPVEVPTVSRIYHRDGMRSATVTAAFAPDSQWTAQSMAKLLESEVLPALRASDLRVEIGGEAVETSKTQRGIQFAASLAILGILTVIAIMLDSILEALFVVLVIPFGFVGVFLAFFAHGMPLSLFALLGVVGLSGVVVNTSIVMVDGVKRRLLTLEAPSPEEERNAMVDAVVERLRPILVTTLSTLGGVFPTAYGLGGYDAVLSPMSLALGWGLIFATAITLFLVPSLYLLAQDLRRLANRHFPERTLP